MDPSASLVVHLPPSSFHGSNSFAVLCTIPFSPVYLHLVCGAETEQQNMLTGMEA
jgi:hypothetical protein